MIVKAIADSLPMSVGVALSPLPIAAVVIMLMTARAKTNAPAFLLGWVVGILAVGIVIFLVPVSQEEKGEPTALAGWFRVGLGLLLLIVAARQWKKRPKEDDTVEVPKLLSHLDNFGGVKSLLAGFLLISANLKNLLLVVAGATAVDAATGSLTSQVIAFVVFAAIASVSIVVPNVAYFMFREKAEAMFAGWKNWLIRNNTTVLVVLLLVFGTLILGKGLDILSS